MATNIFTQYPKILYPIGGVDQVLADITTNLRITESSLADISIYEYYDLKDYETPDILATKLYGNPEWNFLIYLANDRFDWKNDFPLTQQELENYCNECYVDPNGIHHYENLNGVWIEKSDSEYCIPITNYEYEYSENEKKRSIRVIRPELAQQVVDLLLEKLK